MKIEYHPLLSKIQNLPHRHTQLHNSAKLKFKMQNFVIFVSFALWIMNNKFDDIRNIKEMGLVGGDYELDAHVWFEWINFRTLQPKRFLLGSKCTEITAHLDWLLQSFILTLSHRGILVYCNIKQLITILLCALPLVELDIMLKSYQPYNTARPLLHSLCSSPRTQSDMEIDEVNVKVEVCYCDKTPRIFIDPEYLRHFFVFLIFSMS